MVHAIGPDRDLQATDAEERGHTACRVEVDTGDGVGSFVLKATPDDEPHGIATEARLLALLDDRTGTPCRAFGLKPTPRYQELRIGTYG